MPLTVVAFARLQPQLSDGMAFFHLLRNVGSSVHFVERRVSHTLYSGELRRDRGTCVPVQRKLVVTLGERCLSSSSTQGLAAISSEVGRQATMIGYINAFYFFALTAVVILPLLLLIRR